MALDCILLEFPNLGLGLLLLLLIVQMLILSDPEAVSAELLNTTYRWSIDLFIEIWSPLMSFMGGDQNNYG